MTVKLFAAAMLVAVGSCVVCSSARAGDWPQWRGPDRTGISGEIGWGVAAQSEPLWRKELGNGHSSFSIAGGRVYTLGYDVEAGQDVVFCFDAESGEEVWRHAYDAAIWDMAHDGGTLTTPTIDGEVVYTTNREGKVFCLDRATGEVRWSRDAMKDHEVTPHTWGFSSSPLVIDGMVIVNYGPVYAFEKATGADVWNTETNFGFAYSTPAAFEHDGRPMLAVLSGNGCAVVDRTSGEELAFYEWIKMPQLYPMTPVVIGEDRIFISAGYDRGCAMLELSREDDGYALTPLWESRVMRNKMSGAVLYDDHLYGFDESILKCIDLDGEEKWRKRGLGTGAMSIVGGRLVIISGRGQVIIAEATPEEYRELSSQDVLSAGTYWSTPVLSGGLLYCRNSLGNMACMDFRSTDVTAADVLPAVPDTLPTAAALVAKHLEAIGGAAKLRALKSAHFTGAGERLINSQTEGAVELAWEAGRGFQWSNSDGMRYGFGADYGWYFGDGPPEVLQDAEMAEVREAGDLHRLMNLGEYYAAMETGEVAAFGDRPCYVVNTTTPAGSARKLYFDVETGFYAGFDGEGTDMWIVTDYRDAGNGLLLPMRWTSYDQQGEMEIANFERVVINEPISDEAIAVPEVIVLMARSPEEKAAADRVLAEKYGATLVGDWEVLDSPQLTEPARLRIEGGFLTFQYPNRPASLLTEPDGSGSMTMIGTPVTIVIVRPEDDPTGIEQLNLLVGPNVAAQLKRVSE